MTGEFRCFSCANPVCALAGRVPSIIPCDMVCKRGECLDGSIVLKKHDTGFVLSCDKYPCRNQFKSLWLPKMIKNAVTKPEHPCRSCSIALNWPMAKVHLQLNMQLVPPGVFLDGSGSGSGSDGDRDPSSGLVCLCCSRFWQEMGLAQPPLRVLLSNANSSGNGPGCGSAPNHIKLTTEHTNNPNNPNNPDKYNAMSVLMNAAAVAAAHKAAGTGGGNGSGSGSGTKNSKTNTNNNSNNNSTNSNDPNTNSTTSNPYA